MVDSVGGAETGIAAAEAQFQKAYDAYAQDSTFMHTLLEDIAGRRSLSGEKISTDMAYMMLICAFGQMVQLTGDRAGAQSAAQGVGAACSNKVNEMVSDFNVLQDPSSTPAEQTAAAADLSNGIGVLQNTLAANALLPKDHQWIDPATASNITTALNDFSAMFGGSPGVAPSAGTIQSNITTWSSIVNNPSPPTSGQASRSQATQNLQTALGHLNTTNSAFSSSTTIQGNLLQSEFSQVTTMSNAMRDLLQSLLSFARTVSGNLAPK